MLASNTPRVKATEGWQLDRWAQIQARALATRRPAGYGHLKEGCDVHPTRAGLQRCPLKRRGAMRSLMSGDTITDDISSNHFKLGGTGDCNNCGHDTGSLEHTHYGIVQALKWEVVRKLVNTI